MLRHRQRLNLAASLLLSAGWAAFSAPAFAQTAPVEAQNPPPAAEVDADGVPVAETETVIVRGRFIPEPMRQTSEVATFLTGAELARTGDDNAAAALTRLAGLSVSSSGFVYVRGLGDRYSSALLNGSPLPSPEPLRRQAPLDLFPSNILSGATVQKTFSPNFPGEFGGGIIDLRTLRTPDENFTTVKASTGGSSATTLRSGLVHDGANMDWTGLDRGLRDLPAPIAAALGDGLRIVDGNYTDAELQTFGRSLVNSPLSVVQRQHQWPDLEAEMTFGRAFERGGATIGLVGVLGYASEQRTKEARRVEVLGGVAETEKVNTTTDWNIVFNAFASASAEWDDHTLSLSGLLVRSTTKKTEAEEGTDVNLPSGQSFRNEGSAWYERELLQLQLDGEHSFGDLELSWRGAVGRSTRFAPYERGVSYAVVAGVASFATGGLGNFIRFSDLTDDIVSGGVDAAWTWEHANGRETVLSGGLAASRTERDYALLSFAFTGPRGPTPNDVLRARVDYLFGPDNIDPARFVLNELTGKDDAYTGELTNMAAYVSVDAEITNFLRAAIGVRHEDAEQRVATGNRFGVAPTAPVTLDNAYTLPAATLTWNFADDLQLRLGYSETVARPQFRELAFTPYIDSESGRIYQGNPFLTDSNFTNIDARIEYYFGRGRLVNLGLFHKTVENPIEEVIVRLDRTYTRFINAPRAVLYGAEFDFRTSFKLPEGAPILADADWIFALNYTWTSSEVQADASDLLVSPVDFAVVSAAQFALDGTALQGTPEHIANVQIGFETPASQLTLLVGWVDQRIARRGLGSLPSVIEEPGTNVDLVYKRRFKLAGRDLSVGLSLRNLLDTQHREFQSSSLGETDADTWSRGVSYSISVSADF